MLDTATRGRQGASTRFVAPRQGIAISRRRLLQTTLLAGVGLSARPQPGLGSALVQEDDPLTFTLVTNRTPTDLDPHSAYDAGSGVALRGVYEGLLRSSPVQADQFEPILATSWSTDATERVWTFQLREGVTFHDGTPLTAEAVRLSFVRLFQLGLAPSTVLARFIEDAEQITAPDARSLVFSLTRPQPMFLAALAAPYGSAVVNAAALRQHEVNGDWGHTWAQTHSTGMGTGPYEVVAFDLEDGVEMERYDHYWRGWEDGKFERIVVRIVEPETRVSLLERGEADLATTLPLQAISQLENNPSLVIDHRYSMTVRYLLMTATGPLQDARARQALCWAFPYDEVISGVYEDLAKPARGPVAELCRGFDPATFQYHTDLEQARSLLREAGVAPGTTLTMMMASGNVEVASTAELLRAQLAELDLSLDLQIVDFATIVDLYTGDTATEELPHLLPGFWSPDYDDALNHLWPQLSCQAWQAGNGAHYCNQQVEALLEDARTASDAAAYQAALSQIQQIATHDDPAAIYYLQPQTVNVLQRTISGFAADPISGDLYDYYALRKVST